MSRLKQSNILIGPSSFGEMDPEPKEKLVKTGFKVIDNPFGRKLVKHELLKLLPGVSGLIAGLEKLDREVLEKSDLEVISRCGSGLSNIDLVAVKDLGIKLCYTPFGPTTAVAELTLAALLSLLRKLQEMNRLMHQSRWDKRIGQQLRGKTVTIIGFGRIGQRVADLLEAFGVKILAVDPALPDTVNGVSLVPLEDALPQSDAISLHCSGEGQILGEKEFSIMKPGTFLLNAARGSVIDDKALMRALDSGVISGAWLDTFTQEPYSGPLIKYDQVLLTPHVGSYTAEGRKQMEMETVNNLIKAFEDIRC